MGDALCGPSNPLQSFQKQSQLDRTLQQDRLVGPRASAAQGFRSHDPRTGTLDADLLAFEHSTPSPLSFQFQQPPPSQADFAPVTGALGWAADFQKMQISTPNLKNDYIQNLEAARFSSFTGLDARKEAFVERYNHSQTGSSAQQHETSQSKQVFQGPAVQGAIYNTAAYGQQPYQPLMRQPEMWQQPTMFEQHGQQDFQFSETDFEAAFQDAFKHAEGLAQTEQQPEREMYNSNGVEIDVPQERQLPIGSDAINYIEQVDRTHDQDTKDADELARTAGQLLNMVQHDTSDKMRDSQFLNLMRRIRDREVEVQNNDLQPINITGNDKGMMKTYMENETDFHSLHNRNNEAESSQTTTHQSTSQAATHDPNPDFAFPDMDAVYDFTAQTEAADMRPVTPLGMEYSPQYSAHDDEYPRTQVQALHPGGRWYPEQKSPRLERASMQLQNQGLGDDRMSGGVGASAGAGVSGLMNVGSGPMGMGISADDFEGRRPESRWNIDSIGEVAEQFDLAVRGNERHAYHPQAHPKSQPQPQYEAPTLRQRRGVLAADFAYTEQKRQQRQMTQQQRQLQERMQIPIQHEAQAMAQRQRDASLTENEQLNSRDHETTQTLSHGPVEQQSLDQPYTGADAAEAWQRYATEVSRLRNGSDGPWGVMG